MSQIRSIYHGAPPQFPATDQHPDAVRYGPIGFQGQTLYVDAIGGEPSPEQIDAMLNPPRTIIPYTEFRARWNDAEKSALHAARAAAWQIDDFIGLAQANGFIDLSITDEAKAATVAAGVLSEARADIIFSPEG